jgi:YidC/Oxa1 family membrane protein insertase
METRRLLLFLVLSFGFVLFWTNFIQKRLPKNPAPAVVAPENEDPPAVAGDEDPETSEATSERSEEATNSSDDDVKSELKTYEEREIVLGSSDIQTGYALEVRTSSLGASITSVRLADPRMKDLQDRGQQVEVLGTNLTDYETFQSSVDLIDQQLSEHSPGSGLESVHWNVTHEEGDSVSFSYAAPDGSLEIHKTYSIRPLVENSVSDPLHSDPRAYTIECQLLVENKSDAAQTVQYELLGPCGVILENEEHTRKYRDIKLEFAEDGSSAVFTASATQAAWDEARVANPSLSEQQISELIGEGENKWIQPIRYAGVDVQFFAALVAPTDARTIEQRVADPWIERIWPVVVQRHMTSTFADITFRMRSKPRSLSPAGREGDALEHSYSLFVGPKHQALLDPPPFEADKVLDYGSYFGFIARGMHAVLSFLYGLGMPYWLAIISLTVMVRCCLFPLSRKQALSAARMKALQPKLNELKLKFGDDKEKMAKAQMELWRKYDINPLGGCMPLFFQLPVFIGLYTCLNTAVDLRLAGFLWIDNLAAPDALFRMPAKIPFLGQDFNLLPCINVVLFLVQQKLFMPPPTDEQQEMQHKMMNIMTIFFAVMFWHVPAGLCMYFVASSIWSIGERKLLGSDVLTKKVDLVDPDESESGRSNARQNNRSATAEAPDANRPPGFFQGLIDKVMDAAEQAKEQAGQDRQSGKSFGRGKKTGTGKGRKKR